MGTERENITGGTFPIPEGQTRASDPGTESVVGPVFPYRGQEQHGVAVPAQPWLPVDATLEDWANRTDYEDSEEEIKPVPVRIVSEGTSEIPSWRVGRVYADIRPSILSGKNDAQQSVQIRNMSGTDTLYIGPDSSLGVLGGYPVGPGDDISVTTTEPVYGITEQNQVEVAVLIQHSVVK